VAPPTTVASHSGSRAHSCVAFSPATVRRRYILPALAANAATTSQKRGGAEPTAAELDALFLSVRKDRPTVVRNAAQQVEGAPQRG
jgi:hypothetical protein